LRSPQYQPDLDLVVVAPGGELAGFCVAWLEPNGHLGQIEPLGVHPSFQRQGLSQALMAECFRRLATRGAIAVLVQTETTRSPARHAYEAMGFRVAHTVVQKGR
jgi:ribosomal protein S18 acetylase RimI-like enzyme